MTIRINELIIRAEINSEPKGNVISESEHLYNKQEAISETMRKLYDDKKWRRER